MNLPEINISNLLYTHGLRADKSLGQNFLQDREALGMIVRAADILSNDVVLEIGPGLGSLTRELAVIAHSVICIELDHDIIPALQEVISPHANIQVVEGDILKISPSSVLKTDNYLVVANVPYYITSAIFRHLLNNTPRPRRMVLTIQKEVAERICASPGELSVLAISIQIYGTPTIMGIIPANSFYPQPKVDSAVIRVDMKSSPSIPEPLMDSFFHIVKAGFSQKRKTLRNSLSAGLRIPPAECAKLLEITGIDPMRRAETVSIDEWIKLTHQLGSR